MDFGSQRIKRISVTDEVVKRIQDRVCSGTMAVGEKLPSEGEMQKAFGVGRSTIREAIRVLVAMGYIEMKTGLGVFVKSIHEPTTAAIEDWMVENEERMADLMDVRALVEDKAVKLAIERGSKAQIERIEEIHAAFALACREKNPVKLAKLDEEFHHAIFLATNNVYLIKLANIIAAGLRDFRAHTFSHATFMDNALKPHGAILEAIQRKDVKKATGAMRKHMEISLHDLQEARRAHDSKL